jgi:hypothetical protein
MATRFYLPSSGPLPEIQPPIDITWDNTAGSIARKRALLQPSGSVLGAVAVAGLGVNPSNTLVVQYTSTPLLAQTISGTITGQIQAFEAALTNNYGPQMRVFVWRQSDSSTWVLYPLDVYNAGTSSPPEFATSNTNRVFPQSGSAGTLTSQTAADGDVLVFEIGFRQNSTDVANGSLRLGDNGSSGDLPADQTTAGPTFNPWLQLSQTILFKDLGRPFKFNPIPLMKRGIQ